MTAETYKFPILDVCGKLTAHVTGTGDALPPEQLEELTEWLRWRISDEGWVPGSPQTVGYDTAVRNLAFAALALLQGET